MSPTPCVLCGLAVAPGRTAGGKKMCTYCEEKARERDQA